MTPRERYKALLVEWLVKFGTDWTPAGQVLRSNIRDEVNRIERLKLIEYNFLPEAGKVNFRLTKKALELLGIEENDRE